MSVALMVVSRVLTQAVLKVGWMVGKKVETDDWWVVVWVDAMAVTLVAE